ncbi:Lrp/AsnC family transcriptional regulator [Marinomonas epiphytica]
MNNVELDSYDWRLLKALQQNARLSNVALSEQVNLSPSQCSRRLHRLEQNSLVEAYVTQLDAKQLGFSVTAFVNVVLNKSTPNACHTFRNAVEEMPTILECYSVTGEYDFWLRVISEDLNSLSSFLTESLSSLPSVRDLTSTVVLNRVKSSSGIPLPDKA